MKLNVVIRAIVGAVLASAVTAHAANNDEKAKAPVAAGATLPGGVATYGQLDELRSQAALAEAREKLGGGKPANVNAQARAVEMFAPPAAAMAPPAPASAPAPVTKSSAAKSSASSEPAVRAEVNLVASDKAGQLYAVLNLQDGRTMSVRPGTPVTGLGVIKTISIGEVVAEGKKGTPFVLPFATEASAAAGATVGTVPMPGPMPGATGLSAVMPPIPAAMRGGR